MLNHHENSSKLKQNQIFVRQKRITLQSYDIGTKEVYNVNKLF